MAKPMVKVVGIQPRGAARAQQRNEKDGYRESLKRDPGQRPIPGHMKTHARHQQADRVNGLNRASASGVRHMPNAEKPQVQRGHETSTNNSQLKQGGGSRQSGRVPQAS